MTNRAFERKLALLGTLSLLVSALVAVPSAYASAEVKISNPQAFDACATEANWPVLNSAAYKNAGLRQKEQMRNTSSLDVKTMKGLCYDLATADGASKSSLLAACDMRSDLAIKLYGERAREHAQRLKDICHAL